MNIVVFSAEAYSELQRRIRQIRERYDAEAEFIRNDRLYTGNEVCEILGFSRITLHRRRKSGVIGFVRIGKKVLYRWQDFQHLIRGQKGGAKR